MNTEHVPVNIPYQPPQYQAHTVRKGQRLHGYVTNHSGDWKPAQLSAEYKRNFDAIRWNKEATDGLRKTETKTEIAR